MKNVQLQLEPRSRADIPELLFQANDELQWVEYRLTEAKVSECGRYVLVNQFVDSNDEDDIQMAFFKAGQIQAFSAGYACGSRIGVYGMDLDDIAAMPGWGEVSNA